MMRQQKWIIGFILASFLITSCQQENSNNETNSDPLTSTAITSNVDSNATAAAIKVFLKYLDIKDALVATDTEKCIAATTNFIAAMEQLQASFPKDNKAYIYIDSLLAYSKKIDNAITIPNKRSMFSLLSNSMNQFLKSIEIKNAHIYHQFCPMALHDTGAFWLSQDQDIKNPYFGKEMLECGETVDSLN
jgi:Cu(I)/Ag(I) efflux system membrane fusion protein